jgi:glycosyltransferase involved in cell wall biosynthesis
VNDLRPRVLAILPVLIPSAIISVVKPLLQLHRTGRIMAKITLESLVNSRDTKWADVVVLCRNNEPRYAFLLDILRSRNTPFIFDIDDNLFEFPLDYNDGSYHQSPERLELLGNYIKSANLVRVYSNPLLEKAKTLNRKVEKVFGPVYHGSISSPDVHAVADRITVVYATSRTQDKLYALFAPALVRVLNAFAVRVEAHFWGYKPALQKTEGNVHYHSFVSDYDRFLRLFSQSNFDIGLAPLPNDLFHRSKTNIKFRDYGVCRIAGIYSNVDVYSDCVTDGETGLLVENESEAWYEAMVRLIEDDPLREKIKRQAHEYVCRHYSEEKFEKVWWDQIQRVLAEKEIPSSSGCPIPEVSKIRLLFGKLNYLSGYLRKNGFSGMSKILKRHLFSRWIIFKFRLQTFLPRK